MKKLWHDKSGGTSILFIGLVFFLLINYAHLWDIMGGIKTLQIYLANEMNATQTAKDLVFHRSTILHRLNRIYSTIGTKLESPSERLYYRICFNLEY